MKLAAYCCWIVVLGVALLLSHVPVVQGGIFDADYDTPTSVELLAAYPALNTTEREGNPAILCPFLRMLERSGRLDEFKDDTGAPVIPTGDLKQAADDFGCDTTTACGPVIDAVSAGQWFTEAFSFSKLNPFRPSTVDLERLWDAPPVSHECGFTFENGENGVSTDRLESTLGNLLARADLNDGQLVYQDLLDTKNEICASEGVEISSAGLIETQLIFAFMGGVERGYVEYDDVAGFLAINNQVPATKAGQQISALYLLQVREETN
ncbi:expressed unknown protein [Seminavis robusta]|uniref:Uncharacterized protein n=1 Tax=Seminavis robusta TaxID=568900 RepID=A0A9N8HDX5_9STRA|nr:expressed unknown protein [Seminavis robusta]|eukprot:Sro446_g144730.1 n/a (266) ;mRNA; f:51176-51973